MERKEAMDARRSVRAYDGREALEADIAPLLHEMETFNRENEMTMEWIRDGSEAFTGLTKSYGMFKGVKSLISVKGKKGDKDLKEKAGYFGQLLALDAVIAGFGTCFVGGTYDKTKIRVLEDEEPVLVLLIGYPLEKEPLRQKFIKKFTKKDMRTRDCLICSGDPPTWVVEGIEAALKAPSAMNKKPVKFRFEDDGTLTAFVEEESGYSMTDLGIAKANFEIAAGGSFELGNNARFVKG